MTIFDGRDVSADGITLSFISSSQESHRSHTKHTLIYSSIKQKERKDNAKVHQNVLSKDIKRIIHQIRRIERTKAMRIAHASESVTQRS